MTDRSIRNAHQSPDGQPTKVRPESVGFEREPLSDGEDYEGSTDENGQPHGEWTLNDENGNRQIQLHYNHGKLDGTEIEWHSNGQKAIEITWQDDVVCGTVRQWDEDGNLLSQAMYVDGMLDGEVTTFYENGQKTVWNYRFGELDGTCLEFDGQGKERFRQRFVHGVWVEPAFANLTNLFSWKQMLVWLIVGGFTLFAWFREPFIVYVALMLLVSIVVHEWGHWLVARLSRIPATHFVVGMGPQVCSFVFMRTIVVLRVLPFLGYVLPATMRRTEFDRYQCWRKKIPDDQWPEPDIDETPTPTTYFVNRVWQLVFYLGGVFVNFMLAFCLFWICTDVSNPIGSLNTTVSNTATFWTYVPEIFTEQFSWNRLSSNQSDGMSDLKDSINIGGSENATTVREEYDEHTQTYKVVTQRKISIWILFANINIAFVAFNLLPIPPLDGFRCMIVLIEACIRRPIPMKVLVILNVLGLVLVGALCVVAIYDLARNAIYMLW